MYHACVIGGGIAGLSFATDLGKRGYLVALVEKGNYPRHKVCGEYVSMESFNYLLNICPVLAEVNFSSIHNFLLSSTCEKVFKTKLPLGGFGISRYLLEELLYKECVARGVKAMTGAKADAIKASQDNDACIVKTSKEEINARLVINATGRHSNINARAKSNSINYVGIKYHVKMDRNPELIEVHNFPGGYCGISNIEDQKSCLCYMVNSKQLKASNNSVGELERRYLWKNDRLKHIFKEAEFIFREPVTTSGINFLVKEPVTNGVFNLGDAAGCIAPLTGNGMSMGLRSAFTLAGLCDDYFSGRISKNQLTSNYSEQWKSQFQSRIKLSRYFQKLSEYPTLTRATINVFNRFPDIAQYAIKYTHGQPF